MASLLLQAWFSKKAGLEKSWERGGGEGQALRLVSEEPLHGAAAAAPALAAAAAPGERAGGAAAAAAFPGYKLTYVTAQSADAGTNSALYAQLEFEGGSLACREVQGSEREGQLQPGGVDEHLVPSDRDLGQLRAMQLWSDGSGSVKEWQGQRVVVQNLATRQQWAFEAPGQITPDGMTLKVRRPLVGSEPQRARCRPSEAG